MNITARPHGNRNNQGMQLTNRQDFPAPPDTVFAMVTDESFLRHAAAEMGSPDARVASSSTRTAIEATVEAPPEVRPFVGQHLTIAQEVTWGDAAGDGSRPGTFSITVPGAPVTFAGTVELAPTASGSTVTYDDELTVRIPLLGARIEKEAAPAILEALDAQARVGRSWLTR